MIKNPVDISVIICTRNRDASLKKTLECLSNADKNGISVEVVVVDNGSRDDTPEVVKHYSQNLKIHYLFEPHSGKAYALNCAIENVQLGDIVAVLDDDMSPNKDWFQGVVAICGRWPEADFFTGHTYIIWPEQPIPKWSKNGTLKGWAFSAASSGKNDSLIALGRWPSGNHFWFRSRAITEGNKRFLPIWTTEPQFTLRLQEEGKFGVIGPDAVAGHRIQPALLKKDFIRKRAFKVGKSFANLRLRPYKTVRQAILLKKYPLLTRVYCAIAALGWCIVYCHAIVLLKCDLGFVREVTAAERMTNYFEMLRIAKRVEKERERKVTINQQDSQTRTYDS